MTNPQKFFDENLRKIGPTVQQQSDRDPEKYNLYCGLIQMANQIGALQEQLDRVEDRLRKLSSQRQ